MYFEFPLNSKNFALLTNHNFSVRIANKDDIIIFNGLTSYYNKDYKTALNFFNSVKKSTMMTWTSSAFSAHSNKYFLVKTLYHLNDFL